MRIVIATGIYPPDIGGPALYAEGVKESFERAGYSAPLVLFGGLKSFPSGVRHLLYVFKLLYGARGADAIIAFDTYSVGVPAAFVGFFLRIPVILRVGGDFVWETYVERTGRLTPLPLFYQQRPSFSVRERIAFWLIRWMLSHAQLAFNTQWLLDIWQPAYGISLERAHIVENVIGERIAGGKSDHTLLLYGRSLLLKNAQGFRRAFARARRHDLPLTLEERIVSHEKLIERMRHCHAVVLPSISDVAPNTIIDALRCGKPFLLTKYSGYAEKFKDYGVIVDPLDEESMARGMEVLADPKTYKSLCARIAQFREVRTYDDVANDFLEILQKVPALRPVSDGIRVLQIGSDRSKRGILYEGSTGFKRQEAYAERLGELDIIGFSLRADDARPIDTGALRVHPTNSYSRLLYWIDAIRIATSLARPDVVSVQDPFEVGLIGWLIARRFKRPLHVQVHTDFLSPEYVKHSWVNRIRVWIAGFVLRRAAGIRVVSERIQESLEKTYRLNVRISALPIFADVEGLKHVQPGTSLAPLFEKFSSKLLVVSRLESEKNVRLAVEAFAKSAPHNACLIIVGDGSRRLALQDVAKDSGAGDRIFFEGEQDTTAYYSIVDLVLVPSLYEGYGLVAVEALAAGKPVLSTDVGAAREVGAIVTSTDKFTDALAQWFANGPRVGELKNYPYQNFEEYVRAYCDDLQACVDAQKKQY